MSDSKQAMEKQKNLSLEYARLTSKSVLSGGEIKRMAEIWEEAQSDDVLSLLITEIEEWALQKQGFIDINSSEDDGEFFVTSDGKVTIDYLYDCGDDLAELKTFTLEEVEKELSQEELDKLIAETVCLAVTNSEEDEIVIPETIIIKESKSNYFMEDVFGSTVLSISIDNSSPATVNPEDALHLGIITGDNNTFVMEDIRIDRKSNRDYSDILIQIRGAEGSLVGVSTKNINSEPSRSCQITEEQKNLSLEYARLTSKSVLSEGEMKRMAEIWEEAQSDDVLSLLITEIEEWALQKQGFIDIESIPDIDDTNNFICCYCSEDTDTLYGGGGNDILSRDTSDYLDGGFSTNVVKHEPKYEQDSDGKEWLSTLIDFLSTAKESSLSSAVLHFDVDIPQTNPDVRIFRYELTPNERAVLDSARLNNVLIVLTVGKDSGVISALQETLQEFDNIITVFSPKRINGDLAAHSIANISGIVSQVWAKNPDLSYRQVLKILKGVCEKSGDNL